MCAPSPPAPVDTVGAAKEQGIANLEAARATAKLSNPNLITPYGTQTVQYGINNDPDQATVTQAFSPEQQALYNKSLQTKGLLGDLGVQGAQSLQGTIGTKLDLSGLPAAPGDAAQTREQVINAMMSRVNEDTANTRQQTNSDLIAAGLRPGTKAYDDRMNLVERGYNDARQQAILAGGQEASRDFGMDSQARKDALAELLTARQSPLNEISALTSGAQVANPFAGQGYQAGATVKPGDIMGATGLMGQQNTAIYNAQVAEAAGQQQAGATAATLAYALLSASDRRLKRDIKRIGTHALGIGIYVWTYIWGEPGMGVMSDEVRLVKPEAVVDVGGYDMVNYAMLGG